MHGEATKLWEQGPTKRDTPRSLFIDMLQQDAVVVQIHWRKGVHLAWFGGMNNMIHVYTINGNELSVFSFDGSRIDPADVTTWPTPEFVRDFMIAKRKAWDAGTDHLTNDITGEDIKNRSDNPIYLNGRAWDYYECVPLKPRSYRKCPDCGFYGCHHLPD